MTETNAKNAAYDFAFIGGGVIGLSTAWQLALAGHRVAVIDRNGIGRQASWAGAGILPPANMDVAEHPLEKLSALSFQLHPQWAEQLKAETGIDNGFRRCGAVFLARTKGEAAALTGKCLEWTDEQIAWQSLDQQEIANTVPALSGSLSQIKKAVLVSNEAQIRNPDHLSALVAAGEKSGVHFFAEQGEVVLKLDGQRIERIETKRGESIVADQFAITAGAWSGELLKTIGVSISLLPVRGQMLLFKLPELLFTQIVYEGTRYIVPRDDGHVVVGATLEEAGFDTGTTEQGLDGLRDLARSLVRALDSDTEMKSWAGLRPASFDGFPYIGAIPDFENGWLATGHFRSGLLWSTGTAVVLAQIMTGTKPMFDLSPFRVGRG